jgi:acetyl-CoA carboxylase carboxyltransferase component
MNKKEQRAAEAAAAWQRMLEDLEVRREWARAGSGPERLESEHSRGRYVARERVHKLLDPGTFMEFGTLATTPNADGTSEVPTTFVCGLGEIEGRTVAIGAEDFTVQFGAMGTHLARYKMAFGGFLEELAHDMRIPLVLLLHGVGGSIAIQEAKGYPMLVSTMGTYPMFELLDLVPVVAGVMGPSAGASAARATATHFSVMSRRHGCLFVGGPPVVRQSMGVNIDKFELGGVEVHTKQSGVIDNAADDEDEIFDQIKRFLSYLPSSVYERPPYVETDDPVDRSCDRLLEIVSPSDRRAYNAHALIEEVVDRGSFFEVVRDYGRSLRIGLARISGHPVGIFATDPRYQAGAIDGPAADKQTRWAETCDLFGLPIIYFVDVPGLMIGPEGERTGVLRRGTRGVQALTRARVPIFTVHVRRAYGLAAQGTSNQNGYSMRLAWPTGQWGDMPVAAGVEAEYGAAIAAAEDPVAKRKEVTDSFAAQMSMWRTVKKFGVEEVIDPRETRTVLARLVKVATKAIEPGPMRGPQVRP